MAEPASATRDDLLLLDCSRRITLDMPTSVMEWELAVDRDACSSYDVPGSLTPLLELLVLEVVAPALRPVLLRRCRRWDIAVMLLIASRMCIHCQLTTRIMGNELEAAHSEIPLECPGCVE